MQTFLPYPDFAQSAAALDDKRLGSQRNEVLVLLRANLQGPRTTCKYCEGTGFERVDPGVWNVCGDSEHPAGCTDGTRATPWYNHPAAAMWRGYEHTLVAYGIAICTEWIKRGKADTVAQQLLDILGRLPVDGVVLPPWFGEGVFHAGHRAHLKRKGVAAFTGKDVSGFETEDTATLLRWPALHNGELRGWMHKDDAGRWHIRGWCPAGGFRTSVLAAAHLAKYKEEL